MQNTDRILVLLLVVTAAATNAWLYGGLTPAIYQVMYFEVLKLMVEGKSDIFLFLTFNVPARRKRNKYQLIGIFVVMR